MDNTSIHIFQHYLLTYSIYFSYAIFSTDYKKILKIAGRVKQLTVSLLPDPNCSMPENDAQCVIPVKCCISFKTMALTHKYMTAHFPGLIPLTDKYMTAHFPGLVPLTQIHDRSLSWLDTSNTPIHDRSLSLLRTGTLIKSSKV